MWDVALGALALGTSVVLDWNHWSRQRRAQARERASARGFELVVHYLDVPVELAVKRATARRESGPRDAHIIAEAGVRHMSTLLEPPSASEGFVVVRHLP